MISETASLVMSGPENLTVMAPLHQMRVSQIPLRPSEHATVNIDARKAFDSIYNQDRRLGLIEMQSPLDHVRYNIVGKCSLFREIFLAGPDRADAIK